MLTILLTKNVQTQTTPAAAPVSSQWSLWWLQTFRISHRLYKLSFLWFTVFSSLSFPFYLFDCPSARVPVTFVALSSPVLRQFGRGPTSPWRKHAGRKRDGRLSGELPVPAKGNPTIVD